MLIGANDFTSWYALCRCEFVCCGFQCQRYSDHLSPRAPRGVSASDLMFGSDFAQLGHISPCEGLPRWSPEAPRSSLGPAVAARHNRHLQWSSFFYYVCALNVSHQSLPRRHSRPNSGPSNLVQTRLISSITISAGFCLLTLFHLGSPQIACFTSRIRFALDFRGEHSRAPTVPPGGSRNHCKPNGPPPAHPRLRPGPGRSRPSASRAFSCLAPVSGVSVASPLLGLSRTAPTCAIRPSSLDTHTGRSRSPLTAKFFFPDGWTPVAPSTDTNARV
ncbi:hypothetical protein NDU88_001623 [Pleurodeles waltl]|uniref:Uncharacterized protein n=1 Tax=Pleurodeles waltl TaxID=8319 RepID=A0AAV7U8Y8_PLEWA|nr:hypothetical protein NDU88_001623 [Pleurodeles waltl]